jgi:UDP-N-acetylmuramate dehydrogenase
MFGIKRKIVAVEVLLIREEVLLAPLTTFGIGGAARYFALAATESGVAQAIRWANEKGTELFVLGGGSNLLVRDSGFAGLVLQIGILGIAALGDGIFDVGGGESWDGLVEHVVGLGYAGIECLAGIPGSVGGTPVQNVGAYGQEVSETIASVRAFDRQTDTFVELTKPECRFRYRESLFNTDEPGRYIVTRVRFQLRPGGAPQLKYADLQKRFSAGATPSLAEVVKIVREIRHSKGMLIVAGEPDCRSAGSFFKNPIVSLDTFEHVVSIANGADVPHWPVGEGLVKVPAAWLLEHAGFVKGYGTGAVGISSRHTLALVNRGGATFADVEELQAEIVERVKAKFGVKLEREPVVLS